MNTKNAFTLAEVLITLGIIGVVATMTMPSLIANYQKNVYKNQFKKTYSMISQAIVKAQADLGYTPDCYYYETGASVKHHCAEYASDGTCTRYEADDGGAVPHDVNGPTTECDVFNNAIYSNLTIVKKCDKAYDDGCIPAYLGYEDVAKEMDEDLTDYEINQRGAQYLYKNYIYKREAYVLSDGSVLIPLSNLIFLVDTNGKKGPNKWGYDLFNFRYMGLYYKPIYLATDTTIYKKGGTSTEGMMKNMGS